MTLLPAMPAIQRELRAQSRVAANYGLRVLGAAGLIGVILVYFLDSDNSATDHGEGLFGKMNFTLQIFIWLLVPLQAADCISRERREGTIGLLFLTPLKPRDIIIAKGFVHGLRALTLLLAVIPVLLIPFLMGGVGTREAALAVLVNFSSLCGALAAGLLASCLSKQWLRAQTLACVLSVTFATLFVYFTGWSFTTVMYAPPAALGQVTSDQIIQDGFEVVTNYHGDWGEGFATLARTGHGNLLMEVAAGMALLSMLFLVLIVQFAAWRLRRHWREEPPSARQKRLWAALSTPLIAKSFLKRWLRRQLARNPIGWLETRSWSGRTVMWGWFAVMVAFYGAGLSGDYSHRLIYNLQHLLVAILLLGLAASAAGSFQRERETGVMELLLVSPMSVGQIIFGRLRGLWGQFFPALALLVIVWLYFHSWMPDPDIFGWLQFYCAAFLTIPVIGLYFSLRQKNFISAFLFTSFLGLLLPLALKMVVFDIKFRWVSSPVNILLFQLVFTAWIGRRLYRNLRHRNFAFSRTIA